MSELIAGPEKVVKKDDCAFWYQPCWWAALNVVDPQQLVVNQDIDEGALITENVRHEFGEQEKLKEKEVTASEQSKLDRFMVSYTQRGPWPVYHSISRLGV